MINMFTVFYLIFLMGCGIASIFILYHITKYSINKHSSSVMLVVFVSVMTVLVIFNIIVFQTVDFNDLLDVTSGLNSTNQSF